MTNTEIRHEIKHYVNENHSLLNEKNKVINDFQKSERLNDLMRINRLEIQSLKSMLI